MHTQVDLRSSSRTIANLSMALQVFHLTELILSLFRNMR